MRNGGYFSPSIAIMAPNRRSIAAASLTENLSSSREGEHHRRYPRHVLSTSPSSSAISAADIEISPEGALSILAGTVAFSSTLAISTWTQKLLCISTGTPAPIPSLVGFATVCVASLVAHQAAIGTYCLPLQRPQFMISYHQGQWNRWTNHWRHSFNLQETAQQGLSSISKVFLGKDRQGDCFDLKVVQIPMHTIRICVVGILAFKVLGGRFWAIAPSSYTHLGSFARPRLSLPAGESYASTAKRAALDKLGRRVGCHTCGSRSAGKAWFWERKGPATFVGDHMPPRSVAEQINKQLHRRLFNWKVQYRFYPQCTDCSSTQGGLLAKATSALQKHPRLGRRAHFLASAGGGKQAYNHGHKFRWNHLAGGFVGGLETHGGTRWDVCENDNQQRYKRYQTEAQDFTKKSIFKSQ